VNFKINNIKSNHSKENIKKIVLVGTPNVGKSVMFNNLTGIYATVSNYPGTSVEIIRGKTLINNVRYEVIDTPGMYSLIPITEEERISRRILIDEKPDIVLHMIDAKNLERMLHFTLQLIEGGFNVILVLNMIDELDRLGKKIDIKKLHSILNIPIVEAVSVEKKGIDELINKISEFKPHISPHVVEYPFEKDISKLEDYIKNIDILTPRFASLLMIEEDEEIFDLIPQEFDKNKIREIVVSIKKSYKKPIDLIIAESRQKIAGGISEEVIEFTGRVKLNFSEKLSRLTINPLTGLPILLIVLYLGLYIFVGKIGAGVIVDFLEGTVFEEIINPFLINLFDKISSLKLINELFVGEYGILTMGLRYSFAIILPIISVFFFVFAIIEDTGYLPRLAMLIDRIFKKIGLSGRAVIPIVLGFGCDTMATVVTRTLPTKRERVIATVLLALSIPCSAQLGLILALFQKKPISMIIWLSVLSFVFLLVGFLSAKIMPGDKPIFYMELPPLRLPKLKNILIKTFTRVEWYLKEIVPVFILTSLIIWFCKLIGLFDLIINVLKYPMNFIGLPSETSKIFLFGFFRRDYGAAGLYDLNQSGLLSGVQLVVSAVTLTLFLPCITQLIMNIKERGIKTGLFISIFVLFISYLTGYLLNIILQTIGVVL
jgi:ferrous iron transport protein B